MNVNLQASGAVEIVATGTFNFLRILSATGAFQISFDGSHWKDSAKNNYYRQTAQRAYFRTVNGQSAAVVFASDLNEIAAQDTAQSQATTFVLANLGVPVGAAAGAVLPACDANGYLQITNNMMLLVSGKNAGRPRQTIVFSVSSGSLNVLTPDSTLGNQYVFMTIPAGQVIPLDSDTDWILSGAGGTAKVSVGQIFLNQA